jgi:hypothetical protein
MDGDVPQRLEMLRKSENVVAERRPASCRALILWGGRQRAQRASAPTRKRQDRRQIGEAVYFL